MRKYMKRIACSALTAALLLSLTACGSKPGEEASRPQKSEAEQASAVTAGGPPLQMVCDSRSRNAYTNQNGYYDTFVGRNEEGENIIYTDFATGTRSYLCEQPDCLHKDDTCTSYFAGEICGSSALVPCGETLYRFFEGVYTADGAESARPKIWSMNLDGTNRTLVYTAPNEEQPLFNDVSTTDGVRFYFPLNKYEKATYDPEKEQSEIIGTYLGCFDMETQQMTILCQLPEGNTFGWVGCAGRELIFMRYEKSTDTGKNMQYFEALNVDSLETRRLPAEWEEVDWRQEMRGQTCYSRLSKDRKDLETLDFATGQVQKVELDRVLPPRYEVWLIRDGHALLSWEEEGEERFYALDLATGELHQTISEQDQGNKGGSHPCMILAEYGEQYLIYGKQEAVPTIYYHLDGTTEKRTLYLDRQAMIPKEDYWAGNAENMTWIQDRVA